MHDVEAQKRNHTCDAEPDGRFNNPYVHTAPLMKNSTLRQAWREKLSLNMFICGCAVFLIAVLGVVTCPTDHLSIGGTDGTFLDVESE